MATDSAIASSPQHALISAYKNLRKTLQSKGRPRNVRATCEAICGFVRQLRGVPAWQAELERRATFLVRSSGEGSPWKQAARNAVKFLRERKKIDDPLEVAWMKAGLTTPKFLRYVVQMGVDFSKPLKDVIDALRWVLNRKGLSEKAQCALDEWWRQSVGLYDEANALQADGCRLLNLVYGDLRENPTTPSGALCAVDSTPGFRLGMRDAAESLLHWVVDDGKAPAMAAAPVGEYADKLCTEMVSDLVGENDFPLAPIPLASEASAPISEPAPDNSAWVLISKLQPPRIPNVKERKRYIEKHPEIRSRRKLTKAGAPHPKRLEVHVGDWIKHWDKMDGQTFNALDSADPPPITNDDLTEDFMDGATKLYSKVFQGKKSRP